MRLWKAFFVACAMSGILGCAPSVPLQRAQVGALVKDADSSNVDRILGSATVVAQVNLTANNRQYAVRQYRLLTGTRQEMMMVCTPTCIPIFTTVPVTSDYVVIQRVPENSLFAWGTLEELSKDPDSSISSIMPTVKAHLEEAKKKQ